MTVHSPLARTGRAVTVSVIASLLAVFWSPTAARADWIRDGQWQLTSLRIHTAWRYGNGAGITVAVLDSGVDAAHPDLTGQVLPGIDLVDGSTDGRTDFVGHGTTVAALIAGRADDQAGIVGVAPSAKILPVRVLDRENRYSDASVIARGVRWAVDHGAEVINMSLGGASESIDLADAIGYAQRNNVVVVACTGNVAAGGTGAVWYPARERGVVAVAGLVAGSPTDRPWSGGLTGPQTVLSAPAADLLGARPGGYWRVQGTSFAAPLVSAAAALVRSRWPGMTAVNVVNRLVRTARDLGTPGRDNLYGFGELDPVAALTANVADVIRSPLGSVLASPGWGAAATSSPVPTASRHGSSAGLRARNAEESPATALTRVIPAGTTAMVGGATAALSSAIALGALLALLRRHRIRRTRRSLLLPSPTDRPRPPPPPR